MEQKSETVRARMEPSLKHDAEGILSQLGLSTTDAINLFFRQLVLHEGLPFDVRIPNKDTLEAMQQVESGKGGHHYKTARELFRKFDE